MKNAKFRQILVDIVKEAGLSDGCSKSQGNLLYYVASKVKSRAAMQNPYLFMPSDRTKHALADTADATVAVPRQLPGPQAHSAEVHCGREGQGMHIHD